MSVVRATNLAPAEVAALQHFHGLFNLEFGTLMQLR